ncbi:MAG: phosphotransferase [Myxococcota bacterium]
MRVELDPETRAALPADWQRAFAWAEERLGGRVVAWASQPRWRPACFFELERENGEILPLYWRGARGEFHTSTKPLEREGAVIDVFERHGIPVPHAYGVCSDPPGLLLEKIPGRFGLASATDEAHRTEVLDAYLSALAKIHAIPIEAFESIGYRRPVDAEASCLGETLGFERSYRAGKTVPDPMLEFQLAWVKRNVPKDRDALSFLVCDSGQFMFDDAGLTGLLDFELAYIGDYAADLAGFRTRDLTEPFGAPLGDVMRRYGELSGREVDLAVVDYHTVRFALLNPLSVAHQVTKPDPAANYVQYLGWYVCYGRCGLEVMADMTGTELDPPSLPDERPSRRSPAIGQLVELLDPAEAGEDGEAAYQRDRLQRTAVYLDRSDRYGAALEADDLDDAAALLGTRPSTWQEADAALEALVLASGPERDADFMRFFHRRLAREESLLDPVLREQRGAALPPLR